MRPVDRLSGGDAQTRIATVVNSNQLPTPSQAMNGTMRPTSTNCLQRDDSEMLLLKELQSRLAIISYQVISYRQYYCKCILNSWEVG